MTGPDAGAGPFGAGGFGGSAGGRLVEEVWRLLAVLQAEPEPGDSPGHVCPECKVCPICRALAAVRGVRPEVVEHLLAAGGELLAALRELQSPPAPGAGRPGAAERIDIQD